MLVFQTVGCQGLLGWPDANVSGVVEPGEILELGRLRSAYAHLEVDLGVGGGRDPEPEPVDRRGRGDLRPDVDQLERREPEGLHVPLVGGGGLDLAHGAGQDLPPGLGRGLLLLEGVARWLP